MSILTFDDIKRYCIPGESVFKTPKGVRWEYIGFRRGRLVTVLAMGTGFDLWYESQVKAWEIEKMRKPKVVNEDNNGEGNLSAL